MHGLQARLLQIKSHDTKVIDYPLVQAVDLLLHFICDHAQCTSKEGRRNKNKRKEIITITNNFNSSIHTYNIHNKINNFIQTNKETYRQTYMHTDTQEA